MNSTCAGCGFVCEPHFAFCPRCGAARSPAAEAAEVDDADRRQVTVLFADLSGFTALAERLDPETLRSFQNDLFQTLAQAVARYDGFVEKFVGDAVMAVFGAPRAHEDDPLRALKSALDMMQGVARLDPDWRARLGSALALHIGIHTGPVVAGSLGGAANGAYAVTGDTVNTASRLLAQAAPGTVLVSESTQALVRHAFDFEPSAELALRGKTQSIQVHRLRGARGEGGPARGLAELGLSAPMVGRDEAMAALHAAFERMTQGRAQVVAVVGEAGAGKSRLLSEFLARLERAGRLAGVALRRAACSSLGEPTYGTFGALLRDAWRLEADASLDAVRQSLLQQQPQGLGIDADEADAVAQVLSYLLGIDEARPHDIEPEQLQRQIRLAARALLERRLAQQPLLLVVDDLHWADAASKELLGEMADQLADQPLMLLLCQRPDARELRSTRAEHARIELGPLRDEDTRALVGHLLGGAMPAPVREFVAARAGGNPFFVEESLRSMAHAGLLVRRPEGWTCEPGRDALAVPPTLYGLLLSRIDRLDAADGRLLQEAAVLGATFERALLQRIASEPQSTDAALCRLAAADLVRATDTEARQWRFTHALLHDVAYQKLLIARRTELHRRTGEALEALLDAEPDGAPGGRTRSPRRLAQLEALGHHWRLSPDKARGAHYLMAAGDWARAVYANDDAIRHYERALQALAEASMNDTVRLGELDARERLADLLALRGQRADALAQYARIQQSPAGQHDPARAARVLRKVGRLHWEAGERERAGACFGEGLALLAEGGAPIEHAHLLQEMGRLAFRAGDNDTALALAQRALDELPPDAGDAAREAAVVRAQASNTLGVALARLGRPAEAVAQIERSVAEAEANDMPQAACRGYTNLGVLYASLDPQRSIQTCLRGLEAARKVGDLGFQSHLYANLAVAYCALTNRCEAEGIEAALAAASLDRRLGLTDHLAVPLIVLGQIHQCHGDAERAFACYREALQLAEHAGEPQLLFPCYDGLATLHLDAGQRVEAQNYLALARSVCERAGLEPDALMVLPFLC